MSERELLSTVYWALATWMRRGMSGNRIILRVAGKKTFTGMCNIPTAATRMSAKMARFTTATTTFREELVQ